MGTVAVRHEALIGGSVTGSDDVGDVVGETTSFRRFYLEEFPSILAYLLSVTGSLTVSEDLAQETFTRAYRDWQTVSDLDRPGGWARTVAHNLAVSRFRRLTSRAKALTRLRSHTDLSVEMDPRDDEFWAEVRRLPERQAHAIALHYVDDLSVAAIAEVMGCAVGTAKVHLHRGRVRLAERLGADANEMHEGGRR